MHRNLNLQVTTYLTHTKHTRKTRIDTYTIHIYIYNHHKFKPSITNISPSHRSVLSFHKLNGYAFTLHNTLLPHQGRHWRLRRRIPAQRRRMRLFPAVLLGVGRRRLSVAREGRHAWGDMGSRQTQQTEAAVGICGRASMEEPHQENRQALPPPEADGGAVSILAGELRPQLRRRPGSGRRWPSLPQFLLEVCASPMTIDRLLCDPIPC